MSSQSLVHIILSITLNAFVCLPSRDSPPRRLDSEVEIIDRIPGSVQVNTPTPLGRFSRLMLIDDGESANAKRCIYRKVSTIYEGISEATAFVVCPL